MPKPKKQSDDQEAFRATLLLPKRFEIANVNEQELREAKYPGCGNPVPIRHVVSGGNATCGVELTDGGKTKTLLCSQCLSKAEKEKTFIFTTYRVADISTQYITAEDAERIRDGEAPGCVAEYDEGGFFYVPDEYTESDIRDVFDCMSEQFVELVVQLWRQKIPYFRFDADGADVDNAPEVDQ